MNDFSNGMDEFVAKIAVVGAGGQGSNLINRLHNSGIKSATTIALNTDANHLRIVNADRKVLIGKSITRGLGAGGFPEIGMKAAEASKAEIESLIAGYDLVFLAAGMGGGTGSGTLPIVADIARSQGSTVVAFVTYPFSLERSRKIKADWALEQIRRYADTTVIIENDKVLSYAPNLQIEKAFELIDSIACNAIRGITDTIMFPSLINLDLADVRSVMRNAGTAVINLGSGSGHDKVEKAVKSTLEHPLMNVSIEGGKSALVHVSGSHSLSIEEATHVGEGVTQGLGDSANVIFGARLDETLGDQIKVMSIVTGVTPTFGAPGSSSLTKSASTDRRFLEGLEGL